MFQMREFARNTKRFVRWFELNGLMKESIIWREANLLPKMFLLHFFKSISIDIYSAVQCWCSFECHSIDQTSLFSFHDIPRDCIYDFRRMRTLFVWPARHSHWDYVACRSLVHSLEKREYKLWSFLSIEIEYTEPNYEFRIRRLTEISAKICITEYLPLHWR